jgi:endo-1,4-beta-D-glucanase Y
MACTQTGGSSGGSGGSSSGGSGSGGSAKGGSSGSGSGGSSAKGGSSGSGSGGSAKGGSSGSGSGGSAKGGSSGSGGSASGGGSGSGSGGSGAGGSANGGGSGSGAGGSGSGGAGGGDGGAGGGTGDTDMISDFEDTPGKATMIKSGGRTGYWYVYFPKSDSSSTPPSGTTMTPALANGSPIASEKSDSGNALHVKGSGLTGDNNYAGTGAPFKPHDPYDKKSDAYDVSAYTGISFKIKSGSGTLPPTFFEVLTKDNQPNTSGGSLDPANPGPDASIGLYNTRGWMLTKPWLGTDLSTSWQTVTIPFGQLIPRHLCDAQACGTSASRCQPPALNPKNVLGIQFSFYATENGWPTGIGTPGTFDLWIDDVAFTKGTAPVQTMAGFPAAKPYDMGSCKLPTGPSANPAYLVPAYQQWKNTFVKGGKVVRPENQNDTVSEGIAYGMLISANMHDEETFKALKATWGSGLMTWCLGAGGGGTGTACNAQGGGSATDADEDAAFALLQAAKIFNNPSYKDDAMKIISQIWAQDIDSASKLPKGGSNYGAGDPTNPSYFAPSHYAAFKAAGDSNDWDGVITAVYGAISKLNSTNSNGLYAAWCSNGCSQSSTNKGGSDQTDLLYQYDSHRIPMRIGMDVCFGGSHAADAKAYVAKTTSFFATNANAGKNGVSRIFDVYDPKTSNVPTSGVSTANNSASIIGTAAVGAMADGTNTQFIEEAYQATFDVVSRGTLSTDKDTSKKTAYSYYNATVGLLTLLIMTGNFSH